MQKSNKNEIFMARVKNSNCLNFCTQVDPSETRKTVNIFFLINEDMQINRDHSHYHTFLFEIFVFN